MLTSDVAAFVGFVCETLLYGVNAVLFGVSLIYLVWRRRTRDINTPMLIATLILFALCTTHFALEFENMLRVLVLSRDKTYVPIADESHLLLAADIIFSITDFFGNLVLTYRCWVAWGQAFWAGAIPLVIALASLSCAMSGLGILATTAPTAAIAPADIARFGTASFSISLILNFLLTALIVGKLYALSRFARRSGNLHSHVTSHGHSRTVKSGGTGETGRTQRQVRAAMAVIIESGALFLVAQFIFVVVYAMGNPAQGVIVPITLQIYGIAPMLIIVRVGMGLSSDRTTTTAVMGTGTSASLHFAGLPNQNHTKSGASDVELSPVDSSKGEMMA